jgi:hypothetical protein
LARIRYIIKDAQGKMTEEYTTIEATNKRDIIVDMQGDYR